MRVLQNGIANNFGLVGKSIRRYLGTTALTATGLMALATPALADNWTDHTATEGSISIDTAVPNTTNITQHTNFVKVQGDGDINAGWTVNVAQPSSGSKYVLYDTENDPTKIMGALNANGQIYIFDKNGVIFGKDSQVNVGSIVASTGTISDANLHADKLVFENVGGPDAGEIVNEGTVTVAESGLAAFVAPTVVNSGVINANAATVVLASGEKVAIDLYGDNLVSIATDGALEEALVENKGAINAAGGKVALSAQAAKSAVDNVINMDGVIDVSSVTTKGGKIILGGGNKGVVKVAGKLKADGATGGGSVKVTGQNVDVQQTAEISVNATSGDAGDVLVYGRDYAIFSGRISGRGGKGGNAEVSAGESVGYYGMTDLGGGTLVIDPKNLTISNSGTSGVLADLLSGGTANVNINAQALADTLATTNVNLWASETLSTAAAGIDLSTWSILFGLVKGITTHDLNLAAPTVNINGDIILGTGKLTVNDHLAGVSPLGLGLIPAPTDIIVNTLNLNGLIKTRSVVSGATTLAADAQIDSTANTINVKSPNAKIQQAISFAEGSNETINVAKGTYNESVNVNKTVTLKGAKAGTAGSAATRGTDETIIDPSSPGFYVTASNTVIDGFTVTGTDGADGYGIHVDGASNVTLKNNRIYDTEQEGVLAEGAANIQILSNLIHTTGKDAIALYDSVKSSIIGNYIGYATALLSAGFDNIFGDGILLVNSDGDATKSVKIQGNKITETHNVVSNKGSGVQLINSDYVLVGSDGNGVNDAAEGNEISKAFWDGIRSVASSAGTNTVVRGNKITDINQVGVFTSRVSNVTIDKNNISSTGDFVITHHPLEPHGAITSYRGSNVIVTNNVIDDVTGHGVYLNDVGGTNNRVHKNTITNVTKDGIQIKDMEFATVRSNKIRDAGANGIHSLNSDNVTIGGHPLISEGNDILRVGANGIKIDGGGTNHAYNNKIDSAGANGIYAVNSNELLAFANIVRNINNGAGILVKDSTAANTTANWVYASKQGIYYNNVTGDNNDIYGNRVQDITEDGVNVSDVSHVDITKNRISDVGGDSIHGNGFDSLLVNLNDIWNSGEDGIHARNGDSVEIVENKVFHSGKDGILVNNVGNLISALAFVAPDTSDSVVKITGNTVDTSADDGIEVLNSGKTLIQDNDIYYSGYILGKVVDEEGPSEETKRVAYAAETGVNRVYVKGDHDGIHVDGVYDGYEYAVNVIDNDVSYSMDDGIEVENGGRALVYNNRVDHSGITDTEEAVGYSTLYNGADGITVHNIYADSYAAGVVGDGEFQGYAIDIIDNTVDRSVDDGISVHDASSTYIADNTVSNSGFNFVDTDLEDGDDSFSTGDIVWGADGIHVRNVWNNTKEYSEGPYDRIAALEEGEDYYFKPYSVVIRGNTVTNSNDDGIQVAFSGDTLIGGDVPGGEGGFVGGNTVTNSGTSNGARQFGGDGINVVTGYYSLSSLLSGWYDGMKEVSVEVLGNTVGNSLDDGIEVVGATDVEVGFNDVSESGDDGINVLGFAAFNEEVEEPDTESSAKFVKYIWPYFGANIHDNNVVDSGNDGIESRGFNDLEVSRNIVTNSGANGLYVSGFNNGYSYINGNTFAGFDIGGHFESGMIDLVNGASNSFTNGRVGLRFAPFAFGSGEGEGEIEILATLPTSIYDLLFPYPSMLPSSGYAPLDLVDDDAGPNSPSWPIQPPSNFGGSIGAQIFENISQFYVELDNEAFFAPGTPTWLNGLNSSYDGTIPGLTGGLLSEAEFNRIEGKFWHHPDGLLADQSLGRFWFGFFPELIDIDQKDLFNVFDPFNGDLTGLNVRITGLPSTGFGPAPSPQSFAQGLNNIQTFAGGPGTNPSDLNNIETAAGGDNNNQQPDDLNEIDPAAGGDNTNCWSDAINTAAGGQSVNVVYGGSISDNLNQAASCGTSF